jgi:hypothetical protein
MIKFEKITGDTYKAERLEQPFKFNNVKYIDYFNTAIEVAIKDLPFDGLIKYKNGDAPETIQELFLNYNYGSPAPWLGKLLPQGYGFTHFKPNDIYKKCQTENGIQKKLLDLYDAGFFTRYKQITKQPETLPNNYILVVMQNTGDTVWYRKNFTNLANEIMAWSRENKRTIVFKWHNGCIDHPNPSRWFNELTEKSKYASIDYTSPLSILIKNCDMVWTASSMSGIEALICNKPVSIFGETEYMEMTTVSNSPEDAIKAVVPKDLEQWLTYYVRKYCINIYAKDSSEQIKNRVIHYFEKGLPLDELILS